MSVVILAAGKSHRMGKAKGLLDYKGEPFILTQIGKIKEIGIDDIIIVLGKDHQTYLNHVPELNKYEIVVNTKPERGQFSSLQCGLEKAVSINKKAVFVLPIDVPCPEREVWYNLGFSLLKDKKEVVVPEYQGKKGHPVLLNINFIEYLLSLDETSSRLDEEIKKLEGKKKVGIISVQDRKITLNLNTIEAWKKYLVSA